MSTNLNTRRFMVMSVGAAAALAALGGLPQSASAAETAPIGFGAGTTGGGSAALVTVCTSDVSPSTAAGAIRTGHGTPCALIGSPWVDGT
jgi:pectate lyase